MIPVTNYKDLHKGESCIISGNGPSLDAIPVSFLESMPTFGTNRVYLKYQPTYYVCTDPLDVKKSIEYILALDTPKFIQARFRIDYPLNIIYSASHPGWNTFTPDPTMFMYDGCTVTYVCLELAYWMGFETVYLVGVDHRYTWKGPRIQTIVWDGRPDPNHFGDEYLKEGERWQPPNLKRMEHAYKLAREAYEADGREIINLTEGTALDVFKKQSMELVA